MRVGICSWPGRGRGGKKWNPVSKGSPPYSEVAGPADDTIREGDKTTLGHAGGLPYCSAGCNQSSYGINNTGPFHALISRGGAHGRSNRGRGHKTGES